MALFMLHISHEGSDGSCFCSGNEGQRAHIRKYSEFLHLLMSVSESTGFSFFKQKLSAT